MPMAWALEKFVCLCVWMIHLLPYKQTNKEGAMWWQAGIAASWGVWSVTSLSAPNDLRLPCDDVV
uniref:Uncharacterized protein n=1 Tax=Oryza sativa subsp. japonica TaxID=39947 RepID=Q69ME3_ORYSJ|nr:hypothetical protein [Oryza sativa Japonica Group]BAD38553.1 hypothetical protein [Oryza sativa Japonica Group]